MSKYRMDHHIVYYSNAIQSNLIQSNPIHETNINDVIKGIHDPTTYQAVKTH